MLSLSPWATRRSKAEESDARVFLAPEAFELAAAAERMRVDRNGSIVSLLMVRLADATDSEASASTDDRSDAEQVGSYLRERLRLTDTAGWLRDGRIGILLPDTAPSGAWKVAADLCELFPAGSSRPGCEVVVYPEHRETSAEHRPSTPENSAPVAPGVTQYESITTPKMPVWKRALDIAGASFGLLVASPVILAAAVAVRATSPGGAFFLQEREGLAGRRFRIIKLRTMRSDAESLKAGLRRQSEQDGPAFKMVADPRITSIGRLLRKTSIDELPQLINVLRGEMSLVGPRPLPVDESLSCLPWQRQRLRVTPGVTCIWQIYGRNRVSFDEWIRMDLEYATKHSPWMDVQLVTKTVPSIFRGRGQ